MRPEHQLILAAAPLHPSVAELKAIDAFIPQVEDWQGKKFAVCSL